jgi:hypothetical protein
MKCIKCGGPLDSALGSFLTKKCTACFDAEWQSKIQPKGVSTYELNEAFLKYAMPPISFVEIPFGELTPADPTLAAIGRAFDDAIDLAYLT